MVNNNLKGEIEEVIGNKTLLDKITDFVRYACRYTKGRKKSNLTVSLAKKTLEFMDLYRSFYGKFDYGTISKLDLIRGDVKKTFLQCVKKHPGESAITSQLDAFVETLHGAIKLRISIELEKEYG